jgi:hypothetical protein
LTLQSIASGFPLRRAWLLGAVRQLSPAEARPLIALGSTPEHWSIRLAPYWLGAPALCLGPVSRTYNFAVFAEHPSTGTPKHPNRALMPLPRVQSVTPSRLPTRTDLRRKRPRPTEVDGPPMRFGDPTTFEEADSDLHRTCLVRLCYACRLSQPLDVSFRPQPFRPCFIPVTLMGFRLQRVSPTGSQPRLSTGPALRAVPTTTDNAAA